MIKLYGRNIWPSIALVAGIQTAVLGYMIGERVIVLKTGKEIVLPVVPVDPRSLFRGDYVILSYDITRIPGEMLPDGSTRGDRLYVTIEKTEEDSYKAIAVSLKHPRVVADNRAVLQGWLKYGRMSGGQRPKFGVIRYGLESYFVPENSGRALEDTAREKKLQAIVAVDRDGKSAIKGLVIDGERVYDEPMF